MNKDKETMAQDYVRSSTESGEIKFSYSFTSMINSYLAGFDAGQAQLLEKARDSFISYTCHHFGVDYESMQQLQEDVDMNEISFDDIQLYWMEAKKNSTKLLAEKDKEIERLKEKIEELDYYQKAFYEAAKKVGW